MHMKSPAARLDRANRVLGSIDVFGESFDAREPIVTTPQNQSHQLAIRAVLRRFSVSAAHAKVICELSGLGGRY
ncbi:hypothetical protein [Rhizobium sp. Rhizsp82]|uniref:hypothetical protein n=1 Tax=Rhizobium sp. Rhizsp82 TaxID=3243057 RepID=UPI0039B4A9D7